MKWYRLGFYKDCARWIPSKSQKSRSALDMCQHLLNFYKNECYFPPPIAVDETWIHYAESMEWKHPQWPIKRKFSIQPTASKVMFLFTYISIYIHKAQ